MNLTTTIKYFRIFGAYTIFLFPFKAFTVISATCFGKIANGATLKL
jgi:hypothetical protein